MGNAETSSATTRVMRSTQLTSMTRPDTLRVRKKKYSGLTFSRMSARLPLRRMMRVNPQAKTSLRIWENRSTRYAPLKRVASCPRQNTQAMMAATEVISATPRACCTRTSPRVARNASSAPESRTSSGRKAMKGEEVMGKWAASAVRNPKSETNPKSDWRKAERPKPGLNAETRRTQRNAEKQERANCRMQETPNLSAILCGLCVSALEFRLWISVQDGIDRKSVV